jgi:putative ABC transport system permease protein
VYADANYLATYGLTLKAGRYFTAAEIENGDRVALVSEAAARQWENGESPLGRLVEVDALVGGGENNLARPGAAKEVTIIGIIGDVRTLGPREPPPAALTVPYTLRAPANRNFVLRTAIEPAALLNTVRGLLRTMDREQPMLQPITFEEIIQERAKQPRFNTIMSVIFAVVALILAATGIYSVLAYAVAQRSREIGIRMALGARPGEVRGLFLRRGAILVGLGLILGLGLSLALARVMESQAGVSWHDPVPFLVGFAALGILGAIACLVPAQRATKVDPLVALRAE